MFVEGYYSNGKKYEKFNLEKESDNYIIWLSKIINDEEKRCYRITNYDYVTTGSNCGGDENHYYAIILKQAFASIEDFKINGSLASQ